MGSEGEGREKAGVGGIIISFKEEGVACASERVGLKELEKTRKWSVP